MLLKPKSCIDIIPQKLKNAVSLLKLKPFNQIIILLQLIHFFPNNPYPGSSLQGNNILHLHQIMFQVRQFQIVKKSPGL